jgi:spermidine synthase
VVKNAPMLPWRTIDSLATPEGRLELRQRGDRSALITIAGRVLMTSAANRSETALAQLACAPIAGRSGAQVLLGGLGMACTLRAALDALPATARVTVVELNATVVAWCRGPLAALTGNALADRRAKVVVRDVARIIGASAPATYDAIVLDLYEGPHQATNRASDPLYGRAALERAGKTLRPGGVLAIWSEEPDRRFEARLRALGFEVQRHTRGRGGRSHTIYVATLRPRGAERRRPARRAGSP